jgi:predicted amidohydrolase
LKTGAQAPEKTADVTIHLYLANAPQGTLWWDDVSFDEIPAPGPRPVTIATIHLHPRDTVDSQESVGKFLDAIQTAVPAKTDVIVLPEVITLVGTKKKAMDVAEPVPGPTTARLVEVARRRNAYIVASLYEKDGHAIYNTAVLIGRKGEIVGKYRKVYLPYDEPDDGVTPGSDYPVFQTDFGKVGMMICWDSAYADPARALALKGAEIILMPIWDGLQTLVKARGMENGVFLVTSSYGDPSIIQDPRARSGICDRTGFSGGCLIDLNRRGGGGYNLSNTRLRFQKSCVWTCRRFGRNSPDEDGFHHWPGTIGSERQRPARMRQRQPLSGLFKAHHLVNSDTRHQRLHTASRSATHWQI